MESGRERQIKATADRNWAHWTVENSAPWVAAQPMEGVAMPRVRGRGTGDVYAVSQAPLVYSVYFHTSLLLYITSCLERDCTKSPYAGSLNSRRPSSCLVWASVILRRAKLMQVITGVARNLVQSSAEQETEEVWRHRVLR